MIKDQRKMDAVVCYNDQIAFSIIGGLHQIGVSIPEDLSITGYDNSMLAHQHPLSLTTIAHPQEKTWRDGRTVVARKDTRWIR